MEKNKFQIRRENTYRKLTEAGFAVLCEKGYSSASIDDIVNRAGFTKGAFYVHFTSKEQFLLELLKTNKESRTGLLAPLLGSVATASSLEQVIQQVVHALVQHLLKTPEWILVYVDFYNHAKNNEEAMEAYRQFYQDWIDAIRLFTDLLKEKAFLPKETNSLEKAQMIYTYLDGCLLHYNFYGEMLNEPMMTQGFLALLTHQG